MNDEPKSTGARRRRAAYRLGVEAGRRAGHIEAINKLAEVASAVAFQAGEPGTEIAGLILSALAAKPELIERFMAEGAELIIDSELPAFNSSIGTLTYRAGNGTIRHPGENIEMTRLSAFSQDIKANEGFD